ncbi:uncharacterized protein LOC129774103 [Toxorhynchites rutilus septentrionalis]|uniref:uncharacterized protein LOC129774103 n=1 Tax=Toxorhynchites rutilus septentrionalis TaxID=329112 RepID=UPI002478E74F|nr:uncharacterized protein LOC129774103 [Toxorhynchites rutilus septentrionalis]
MFRQIWVHYEDTPLQRIFWRSSPENPLMIYELKTITYGTAAAPYLATRVLKQLADDERGNYPLAAKSTYEDFYVDNYITGTKTIGEAIELRKQMEAMFASAGMQLRKWASNCPAVLDDLPEENRAILLTLEFDKNQSIKTLGLHWEPHTDFFKYVIPEKPFDTTIPLTKRNILSCIAKLFDPLGLVGPVVLTAKKIMQALWGLKNENGRPLDWDREVPDSMKIRWTSYHTQLPQLNNLRIERLIVLPNATCIELHFFSDASEAAYGSCVYVRSLNSTGEIKVTLLTSRSKVAPLKLQSIPRLELCGALLSAELYAKVMKSLRIDAQAYFWVDSTAVLCYLKATPSTWSTFVANRVSKIQHATENCEWNFVAGHNNPADIISRGLSPSKLLQSQLWWKGPSWLQQPTDSWPTFVPDIQTDSDVSKDIRKTSIVFTAPSSITQPFIEEYVVRFSNYQKMLRVMSYAQRFIKNSSVSKAEREKSKFLTTNEVRHAELTIIQLVQQASFPEEWKSLQKKTDGFKQITVALV